MADAQYIVGIDLGTSNCAAAFASIKSSPAIQDFPIVQLVRAGEARPQPLLPSFLYLAGEHEFSSESVRLPWKSSSERLVGEFARWHGARVPSRVISSSKSWLCHSGVDRTAPILPWGSSAEVKKISPVQASAELLRHIRSAWDSKFPAEPLSDQEVAITVPASFDEVARALTVNAARDAGFEKFTLLEEPQAAFYDFISGHQKNLARALEGVRLVLVVDVGGGTSDFTLIQTSMTPEGPLMRRIAVGEHLMLGGDNMDSALARRLEQKLLAAGRKLSATQWSQLVQASREAKEALLGVSPPDFYNVSLLSEGSRLMGNALSAQLTRAEAEEVIVDGFFPIGDEAPSRTARPALQELGLPYAADPGITRHIKSFLRSHATSAFAALGESGALPRPDAILLNGGVFNSPRLATKLVQAISAWWPEKPRIPLLEHHSLDLAVARGAAYYGLVRRGIGQRITGGAARSFYVGLEGTDGKKMALCVAPRGQEEGETVELRAREFQLILGKPVRFPLYYSGGDAIDPSGSVVDIREDMAELPPIHTILAGSQSKQQGIPVYLRSRLTEIGTLELWCVSSVGKSDQWRLEFELRSSGEPKEIATTQSLPANFDQARATLEQIFGNKPVAASRGAAPQSPPEKQARQIWTRLEEILGGREGWRLSALRELGTVLLAGSHRRRRSAEHERIYFQLLGYCLRPGFGYPLDEWRAEQAFKLFVESVQFHHEKPIWNEFWIMWRRISGGLSEDSQLTIWNYLSAHLEGKLGNKKLSNKPKGVAPEGLIEMVRTAASLEQIDVLSKERLGDWCSRKLE
ncbi:MAG: Chaperone protein DnaK, partial [Verrucomicrobiales bacterium]|nr:Chaperone protein DnaK [Verrucomicrobiales bacterium]